MLHLCISIGVAQNKMKRNVRVFVRRNELMRAICKAHMINVIHKRPDFTKFSSNYQLLCTF